MSPCMCPSVYVCVLGGGGLALPLALQLVFFSPAHTAGQRVHIKTHTGQNYLDMYGTRHTAHLGAKHLRMYVHVTRARAHTHTADAGGRDAHGPGGH